MPLCDHCHSKAHGRQGHWNTSELTKEALAAKRQKGLFCGGCVPYGWRSVKGILEPYEAELSVRQLIVLWRANGMTLWDICKTLDGLNVKTKLGRSGWKEGTIRKICRTT